MAKDKAKFTVMEELFCIEYLKDFNGKRAAIAAGYSPMTATNLASKMLAKEKIKRFIDAEKAALKSRHQAEIDDCLAALTEIALADITDYVSPAGEVTLTGNSPNRRAVSEFSVDVSPDGTVKKKIKLRDPAAAITRIAAMTGMDKPVETKSDLCIRIEHVDGNDND